MLFGACFFFLLLLLKGLHLLPSKQRKQLPTSIFNISSSLPNVNSPPRLFNERPEYSFLDAYTDLYYRTHNFYYIYLLIVHWLDYKLLRSRNLVLLTNVSLVTSIMIATLQVPKKFLITEWISKLHYLGKFLHCLLSKSYGLSPVIEFSHLFSWSAWFTP